MFFWELFRFQNEKQNEQNGRNTVYSDRNRQNTRSFGKFFAGNPTCTWPLARADIVVLRSPPPWVLRFQMLGTFLSKLKSMYFVVLRRNKNS